MLGTVRAAVAEPFNLDDKARLSTLVQERAELFRRWMSMAMGNLHIAQDTDTL
jgi:hypothetical protein